MIKMITAEQKAEWSQDGEKQAGSGAIPWSLYLQPPLRHLLAMDAREAQQVVDGLAEDQRSWPTDLPEQYFLVSWQNLNLSYWITWFGNWDLQTGQGRGSRLQRMSGDISLDLEAGTLQRPDEDVLLLEGFMAVSDKQSPEMHWDHDSGLFAIYNDYLKQFVIMDKLLYDSMLVQMLLADPTEFAEEFELVVERYPWVRVYRVR